MILVVGSLNVDYVAFAPHVPRVGETLSGTRFAMHPGGKGANQACAAARLGAPVRMVGRVGADVPGDWILDHLRQVGVDVARVVRDPMAGTGTALIVVDAVGRNSIVVVAGANGSLRAADLDGAFAGARVLLLQLESPIDVVSEAAARARAEGSLVVLDPAPARPLPNDLLELADYVTPNETELLRLCGLDSRERVTTDEAATLARRLLETGCRKVVVKLGEAGALLVAPEVERWWPAFRVEVVDTTAAGDAFNAAFAVALAEGRSEDEAGRFACAAAARSTMAEGAQPAMPVRGEVEALLADSPDR